jgi:hypothetical protein
VKKSILAMLNESEQALLRETAADELDGLDEDDLLDLHTRVRRARTKYSKLYRRRASAQVRTDARRSSAHPKHARTAVKAEIFEDALARVSRHLARAAKESAALLKAERLEAARRGKGTPDREGPSRSTTGGTRGGKGSEAKAKRRTPASKRASASARASTRRKEAARDSR